MTTKVKPERSETSEQPKRGRGRPLTLAESEPKIRKLLASLRRGNFLAVAIRQSGIPKQTVYGWIERGARSQTGPHRHFSDRIEAAEADGEDKDVRVLAAAAKGGNVQAAMFRLERRHHERWGKRTFRLEDISPSREGTGAVVPYQVRIPEPEALLAPAPPTSSIPSSSPTKPSLPANPAKADSEQ